MKYFIAKRDHNAEYMSKYIYVIFYKSMVLMTILFIYEMNRPTFIFHFGKFHGWENNYRLSQIDVDTL